MSSKEKLKYTGATGFGETSKERIKNLKKAKPKTLRLDVDNSQLIRGFDELPFFYIDGNDTHIFWMCNLDQDGKITSVYSNTKEDERIVGFFDTMEEAITNRNELIKMGWLEGQFPNVTVDQENWKGLSRQKRKRIIRGLHKQAIKEERNEEVRGRLKKQLKHPGELLGKDVE